MLAALDDGPLGSLLQSVILCINESRHHNSNSDIGTMRKTLSYAEEYCERAKQLHQLINTYQELDPSLKQQCVLISVSSFIYTSNKIENAGLASETDTREVVTNAFKRVYTHNHLNQAGITDILATFTLLQSTYDDSSWSCDKPADKLVFDSVKLKHWHRILCESFLPTAGQFRGGGACADDCTGIHKYPHHGVVDDGMRQLGLLVYCCWKGITRSRFDSYYRVLYCFALAAFAQFHFVDQHPFVDGNGRMCRFISKFLLDWVLPIPIPMFPNRDLYISSLISGRQQKSPILAPSPLMKLLLDTALAHYTSLLAQTTQQFHSLIVEDNLEQLLVKLTKLQLRPESIEFVKQKFDTMREGTTETIEIDSRKLRIHRYPRFCIDEI